MRPTSQMIASPVTWYDLLEFRLSRRMELLRGWLAQRRGVQAGKRFGLGPDVSIIYPRRLLVGDDVTVEGPAYLHCLSARGVRIGGNTSIARNLWLHCGCTPGDDDHGYFEIGEYSFVGCNAVIGPSGGIEIGDHVQVGPNVTISSENHRFDNLDLPIDEQGVERGRVLVAGHCWIASNVTILAGVSLGEGCVVAAGAVVTRNMPPLSVVAGVPARVVRMRGQARFGSTLTAQEDDEQV